MAKQFKKTNLATAVSIAAMSLGLTTAANAVVVVGGDNGWEVSFDGNVNAFYTLTDYDAGFTSLGYVNPGTAGFDANGASGFVPELDSSRVTSGYLPAFFSFNVKSPTVNGMTATARISFAPVIQNANGKNQFYPDQLEEDGNGGFQGAGIDTREVVVNIDADFGTFSFGRTLSIFGRQAMLKDQTLFGVGAPNKQNGSISAGRTGRGYTYPNFNARFSYKTPTVMGVQAEFGLYDPSVEQGMDDTGRAFGPVSGRLLNETDTPRFEGELTYTTTFNNGSFQLWMDGMWQDIESNQLGASGDVTVAAVGFGADVKMNGFNVLGYYYDGQGLGRSLQFVGGTRCESQGVICQEADNEGYYVQGSYTFSGTTKLSGSWGESKEDGFSAINAGLNNSSMGNTPDVKLNMWTVGVYHDMTSWMKVVAEYSNLENKYDNSTSNISGKTEADVFSLGAFLFW